MRRSVLWIVFFLTSSEGYIHLKNGPDLEKKYVEFMDKMIAALDGLVQRTAHPSAKDQDRASCIYGLNAVVRNIGEPWALAMLDSGSKIESGILNGNLLSLGDYDECMDVTAHPTDKSPHLQPFRGQHCLLTANIFVPHASIKLNGKDLKLLDLFGKPYLPLTMGQCFPSMCKPWVLEEALNSVLAVPDNVLHHLGADYAVNVTLVPTDCYVKDGSTYDTFDWVVLGVILLFFLLGLVSSLVDYYYTKTNIGEKYTSYPMKLLGSFSFYSNSRKLFSLKLAPDAIPSLNGMKFFSMCWVILGHRYMYLSREPLTNFAKIPDYMKDLGKMFILNGPLAVDTFFVISGMLNMYGFSSMMEKNKRYRIKDLISGYIHRYLRLTPAYLMMIAFTATWQYHLRDGPLWDRFNGEYRDSCRETYWMNLVYLNNYIDPDGYCMMQSWYLAVDMQLFWLSPLLLYPLWKWPKAGTVEVVLLTAASIVSPFMVSWYGHIKAPIPITSDHERKAREMAMLYFPSHTKSVSYVLGIAAGYPLYKYKQGEMNLKLNVWVRGIGWTVSAILILYSIFGGYYIFQMDSEYDQLYSAFFIGFQRFFWSLGLIWIIWMCVIGYGGFLNDFLSWEVFIPLGRISYSTYLTHIVVLMCSIAARRDPFTYMDFDLMEVYLGDLVMCMFSGLILTLLVEAPMMNLERLIMGKGSSNKEPRRIRSISRQAQESHLHVA